jgi:exodeoxyribonuclease V alpha subunit
VTDPQAPLAAERAATRLEGTLERVVFANPENAWSVVRLAVPGQGEVTAVGNLLGSSPGSACSAPAPGRPTQVRPQFRIDSYEVVRPGDRRGDRALPRIGPHPGIGKVMAKRLVAAFGEETLEVLEREPERLREVPGIGKKRRAALAEALVAQREIKEVMVFLQSHEVATHLAIKIYKRYEKEALQIVRTDPYRLSREVVGIGFPTADAIASRMGISAASPERVQAGVFHLLGEAAGEGHLYLPEKELVERAVSLLAVEREAVGARSPGSSGRSRWWSSRARGRGGATAPSTRPPSTPPRPASPGASPASSPSRSRRSRSTSSARSSGSRAASAWSSPRSSARRSAGRSPAKVLVVTGGPGTGKTTLVRGMVEILRRKGRKIRLAAPTGRAAKRLEETTGRRASTLHRLLEFDPAFGGFTRGPDRPLDADLVIVDEASMIDAALAAHWWRRCRTGRSWCWWATSTSSRRSARAGYSPT